MKVVIDTNVLVSAIWLRNGAPAKIISMMLTGRLTPCYDYRIINEYREVLMRPKFKFSHGEVDALLDYIRIEGVSVLAEPVDTEFTDEADKKFYEVAKQCGAILITGNRKHFPQDPCVVGAAEFLEFYQGK